MPVFDLRFPVEVREALAAVAAMISEAGPGAVLMKTAMPADADPDFAEIWVTALQERVEGDTAAVLRLLSDPAFGAGTVTLSEDEAFAAIRGFTTLRISLRETALEEIGDEALETGRIDRRRLTAPKRHALACYGALGEIQSVLCDLSDEE